MPRTKRQTVTAKGTYLQIAADMQEDILAGRRSPGERLPTQRELAAALKVTQGTVNRAYTELARKGLISGEVGRGSFVLDVRQSAGSGSGVPDLIDMAANKSATALHTDALKQSMQRMLQRKDLSELLEYQPAAGSWRHRETASRWLSSFRVKAGPQDVALTVGAQQGIAASLLALTKPGAPVLVEEFTYIGMKALAHSLDRKLVPVRMDAEGLVPPALRDAARQSRASCLYCMPGLHNPTNATMSRRRRRDIAAVAEELDLQVIEDGVYDFMVDPALLPLAAHVPRRTVYLTSLSKSVASGLRIGMLAAPRHLLQAITAALQSLVWTPPPLMAEVACEWMDGGVARQLTEMHLAECAHRLSIARHMLSGLEFRAQQRTAHLWLKLPAPWDSAEFVAAAKALGVALAPTSAFAVEEAATSPFVRIGLASPASSQLVAAGLARIASAVRRADHFALPHT